MRLQTRLVLLPLFRLLGPVGFITDAVVEGNLSQAIRARDTAATSLVRDCSTGADRACMANALASIGLERKDLAPILGSVHAPTLLLTGSAHPSWSPGTRGQPALLPHGSSDVVDDAAYLLPLEAPTAFTRSVRQSGSTPPPDEHPPSADL